jgi:hypothetical protein
MIIVGKGNDSFPDRGQKYFFDVIFKKLIGKFISLIQFHILVTLLHACDKVIDVVQHETIQVVQIILIICLNRFPN